MRSTSPTLLVVYVPSSIRGHKSSYASTFAEASANRATPTHATRSSRPSLKPSPAPHVPTTQLANNITANSHTQGPAPGVAGSDGKAVTGAHKRADNPLLREVRGVYVCCE
eukprot:1156585-Pelagomonas_calceolata.AAC.3